MTSNINGQCLCQQITYKFQSEPKAVGKCYCKSCQIKSGSDHIVYLACDIDSVIINGPVKWYQSMGDSELPKQHGFCIECGSTLFGKPQHWPNVLIVYAGSLLDSSTYAPETNLWVQDAPKWSCIDDSLKAYSGNPS